MDTQLGKPGWKKRLTDDLIEYLINAAYLAVYFGLFSTYRRLILRHYSISYMNYGMAVIEALIMAKVILLIDAMHLGRKLEDRRLWVSTLYKSIVFTLGILVFSVMEHVVEALIHGKGWAGVQAEVASIDPYELTAKCMVMFFAFIPFFAFKELGRVLGENKIMTLFFSDRTPDSRNK